MHTLPICSSGFSVDPTAGQDFESLAIEIRILDDGKVVRLYHLETWSTVIAQLMGAGQ